MPSATGPPPDLVLVLVTAESKIGLMGNVIHLLPHLSCASNLIFAKIKEYKNAAHSFKNHGLADRKVCKADFISGIVT